jgi:hypothetical protein
MVVSQDNQCDAPLLKPSPNILRLRACHRFVAARAQRPVEGIDDPHKRGAGTTARLPARYIDGDRVAVVRVLD